MNTLPTKILRIAKLPSNDPCRRVRRYRLATCLDLMGVRVASSKAAPGARRPAIKELSVWELTDLYEVAHRAWKTMCKRAQTFLVKNHEVSAWINSLWGHTRKLFRKMGVETT